MTADDSRLALEEELAFQGETLRGLSDALATQQQDILLLQQQLRLLATEVKGLRKAAPGDSATEGESEEAPPHY